VSLTRNGAVIRARRRRAASAGRRSRRRRHRHRASPCPPAARWLVGPTRSRKPGTVGRGVDDDRHHVPVRRGATSSRRTQRRPRTPQVLPGERLRRGQSSEDLAGEVDPAAGDLRGVLGDAPGGIVPVEKHSSRNRAVSTRPHAGDVDQHDDHADVAARRRPVGRDRVTGWALQRTDHGARRRRRRRGFGLRLPTSQPLVLLGDRGPGHAATVGRDRRDVVACPRGEAGRA